MLYLSAMRKYHEFCDKEQNKNEKVNIVHAVLLFLIYMSYCSPEKPVTYQVNINCYSQVIVKDG